MGTAWIFPATIVFATVVAMELIAAGVHRFIMHGWGWGWHRSHHEPHSARVEKNDLFGLAFAGLSVGTFVLAAAWPPLWWVGLGTVVYGLLYALLHDGLVHRRLPMPRLPRNAYLKRLVQAHRLHHASHEREGAVSFGFLYAPPVRRLRTQLRARGGVAMSAARQSWIGLGLALAIIVSWLALHVASVFFYSFEALGWVPAAALIAAICWLSVGLFIVAHDCMHGSLAPGRPAINRAVGRVALFTYAGFSFDRLRAKHFEHHRQPGTDDDPDFSAAHPMHFWPWYAQFFRQYFGLRELAILALASGAYLLAGAAYSNLLLFWALPAILSSMQLFLFGTYLPHRHSTGEFDDDHRARSNDYGWLVSLLSCFHFGYHHEHHLAPHQPWWRLPSERLSRRFEATPR